MAEDLQPRPIVLPGDAAPAGGGEMFDALLGHFGGAAAPGGLDPKILRTLREEFERSEFFGRDMRRLWVMLDTVVAKSGRSPGAGGGVFDLLNLACGYCQEGALLSAFWGRGGARVRQFAMDLRDAEIDKARRRYAATERLFRAAGVPPVREQDGGGEVEFVAGDASKLAGVGQIPPAFDVVFIRHQNLWHDRPTWQRIYEFALSRIADGGLLVITSYFDREHVLALELLQALGGVVLASEQNRDSRELGTEGKSIDRHVAAIARG